MRALKTCSALLLLIFCLPLWGDAPNVIPTLLSFHRAEHWIVIENDKDAGGCTATAIGPHALLTAQHCLVADEDLDGSPIKLFVDWDGKPPYMNFTPYTIMRVELDGSDHAILLLSGPRFKDVAPYATETPLQSMSVIFWGNPAGVRDQLREGYVMGSAAQPVPEQKAAQQMWYLATPCVGGDSGSAVLDVDTGAIVGLVTYGVNGGEFAGIFALHFTSDQIVKAQQYGN